MTGNLPSKIQELIDNDIGDIQRLSHIKELVEKGRTLYNSDKIYLESLLSKYTGEKPESVNEENPYVNLSEESTQESKSKENLSNFDLKKELDEANRKIGNLEKRASYADEQTYRKIHHKSEGTTLVLSLVLGLIGLPGAGHMYVGKVGKGVTILIGSFILFIAGAATLSLGFGIVLLIMYFVIFIWQIFSSRDLCRYYNDYVNRTGLSPWD